MVFLFFAAAVVLAVLVALAFGLAGAAVSFFLAAVLVVAVVFDVLAFATFGFAGAFATGDFLDCFDQTRIQAVEIRVQVAKGDNEQDKRAVSQPEQRGGHEIRRHTFLAGGGEASKSLPLSESTRKSFIESSLMLMGSCNRLIDWNPTMDNFLLRLGK